MTYFIWIEENLRGVYEMAIHNVKLCTNHFLLIDNKSNVIRPWRPSSLERQFQIQVDTHSKTQVQIPHGACFYMVL